MKVVKCPLCERKKKIYSHQRFFRCCSCLHVANDNILYVSASISASKSVEKNTEKSSDFSQKISEKVRYNSVITGNERGSTDNELMNAESVKSCKKIQKDEKECGKRKKGKWVDKGEYYVWEEETDDENEQR